MVDSIESLIIPRPPKQREITSVEDAAVSLNEIQKWGNAMARFSDDLYNILHTGQLVRSWRIENLEAGKIGAGTITTDQLFLGSGNFVLDGVLSQIRIEDDQNPPKTRVEIGAFGSGSDYGIKVRDASGTVVFQSTSTTFINGAVITNATISDSKIIGMDGGKLTNGTVTDSKIANLSATKITAGTLIVDGNPAIQVTGAGACVFTAGGDIIMRAATNDFNFISFRTSGNAERANIRYQSTGNRLWIESVGGANLSIKAANLLQIFGGSITIGPISTHFLPAQHNTYSLGFGTKKWANIHSVSTNFGDIGMENGVVQTEPDKVYSWADAQDGVLFMRPDRWHPFVWFHLDGNIQTKDFPEPDVERQIPQGEYNADERKTLN